MIMIIPYVILILVPRNMPYHTISLLCYSLTNVLSLVTISSFAFTIPCDGIVLYAHILYYESQ